MHSRGISHRDIKPSNLVAEKKADSISKAFYKLVDMGLAASLLDPVARMVRKVGSPALDRMLSSGSHRRKEAWEPRRMPDLKAEV